jgi:two-component system nitrate/nitrite response regulator NarL
VLDKASDWAADGTVSPELTKREVEIVQLVSQGLANKAVAGQLGVSEGTVKSHLHSIYRKLRVSNRTGLMLTALTRHRKE